MNLADTSRAAFANVDRTAGQRRVLAVFRDGMSRQDIADASKTALDEEIPINVVTPRVRELLDGGVLRELPAVNGRHLLELVKPSAAPRETQADTPPVSHADAAPHSTPTGAGIRKDRLGDPVPPVEPAGVDPHWVKPTFEHHRLSISVDEAKRYLAMSPDRVSPETLAEAREVEKRGRFYVPL